MRQYTKIKKEVEDTKLVAIVCNKCGKEIQASDFVKQEVDEEIKERLMDACVFSVKKTWGYGSNHDLEHHKFDLCEACYDEWINSFAIPIKIETYEI